MNKSHRIVWSDARNAYIVAGENASAKGKPSSVRKALATAIAALFMGPGLAAAQSCEGQNPLTDAQTSTQCYENVDVTVAAGGSVAATGTTAIGVQVQAAPYARNFANQGTLEADAEGYNAYAYGVLFEGRVSGSVVNASTGTVSVSATGQGDGYGDGYGVLIRGDLGGSLANAGTVEVSAQNVTSSGYRYAGAYGVSIDGDVDGTLTNSGNVRAESRADSAGGSSYSFTDSESVRIRGSLNGALANSGAIEAHAQSAEGSSNYNDYVRAYGVSIGEDLTGSLENTGTIHATATRSSEGGYSSYSDYMWAVGVHVGDDLTGELLNSGEILARTEVSGGDQYGYANAYGVRAYGTMSGTIDNAGTIRAESVRTAGEGGSSTYTKAYGVVTGDLVGKLANSGSIGARSEVEEGYAHAYAYGVSTYSGDLIGTIQNDGEIAAEAVSKDGYAGAYGVGVGYNVSGTLQNNGEISARAEASNARSRGVSIRYGDLTGTIGNDGTIDATSITQDGYANAVGVGFGTGEDYDGEDSYGKVSGTLRNAGTVTATALAQGRDYEAGYSLLAMEDEPAPSTSVAVRAGGTQAGAANRWLALLTLLWVCLQGAFGALTVTMKLFPAIVTLHLLGGVVLLSLLCVQAARYTEAQQGPPVTAIDAGTRMLLWLATALLWLQIALGGWVSTNYAVLACTEFPMCQASWWPAMNFAQGFEIWRELGFTRAGEHIAFEALTAIHVTHRVFALLVLLALGLLAWRLRRVPALRRQTRLLAGLAALQLLTGLSNVVLDWPLLAAVLHTGGAGALVVTLTWTACATTGQRRSSVKAPATTTTGTLA